MHLISDSERYNFFAFLVDLGMKDSNKTKLHKIIPLDLLRGRGKSIGGDLDVDDKGSEQNVELLQSLHQSFVCYQSVRHELTLPRRLIPTSTIENTSKNT
jgi:hypothetical protein